MARLALTLSLVMFSSNLLALSPTDYTFQLSPATRELTQQSVRTIFQDSRGFIWLLTQEGLHKYDGYEVTRFRASNRDPNSISHQSTTGITEDKEGYLWISTAGGGLNKYNPTNHSFTAIKAADRPSSQHPLSNEIYTIFHDRQGYIWLGYDTGTGFSRFSPSKLEFEHFFPNEGSRVTRAVSFSETEDGNIWALVDGLGLLRIDNEDTSIDTFEIPQAIDKLQPLTRLNHVMTASDGTLWISSLDSGIVTFSQHSEEFQYFNIDSPTDSSISDQTVYMTMEDHSKNIWVATRSGVNVWEPASQSFTLLNTSNTNFPDNQIFSIFQSSSGIIWIGTFNGLAYGTRSLFKRIGSILGPPNDSINAFSQAENGIIWVGSNTGLYTYDPQDGNEDYYYPQKAVNNRLSSSQVMSLLIESSQLWVGTLDGGLNRVNLETGEVKVYRRRVGDANSISANGITSIVRTKNGTLLVGTYGGGLNILNEETENFSHYQWNPADSTSISSNNVVAITEDSDGEIWIGTENGINSFDMKRGSFQRFISEPSNPESLSSNLAWAIHEDSYGDLWIGTQSGGVNKWSRSDKNNKINRFSQYLENINLPSADIYAITSDAEANIWLSHNRGLSRISLEDDFSEHFDLTHGLQGSEFNHGAVFRDGQSRILFGGNNGFNVIEPKNIQRNIYQPPLQITAYRLRNEEVFFDTPYDRVKEISLPYNFRYASFTFASLDYTNPASNQYRYMLEGFDNSWIDLGNTRSVSFTSLPAGSYIFKVQGTNSDGIWSDHEVEFGLNVTPAPWLSKQAYFSYIFMLLLLIYIITARQRAKSAQAIKRQKELELKVQERTIDLEEARNTAERANRSKSEFLATVTHEIRTPMHGMIGMTELLLHTNLSEQQRKFANAANASGEALLDLINSILDFSKIEAERVEVDNIEFDFIKLLDDICYLQSEPASRKALDFFYVLKGNPPSSIISDPTKLRQVIINLTNNAVKFTEKGFIRVIAEWHPDTVDMGRGKISVTVEDTGIGMDAQAKNNMFEAFTQADATTTRKYGGTGLGLAISKRFVDLLSGEISVDSEIGAGTKIKVEIPVETGVNSRPLTKWNGYNVVILSNRKDTLDALISQLKAIGIEYSKTSNLRSAQESFNYKTALLIDYDYFQLKEESPNLINEDHSNNIILLCSLREDTSYLQDRISHIITKPLTTTVLTHHLKEIFFKDDTLQSKPTRPQDLKGQQRRVALVAEDLETNQRIIKEILEMYDCEVLIAGDGLQAFEIFKERHFDIVFMDCQMPIMDGYQATLKIREFEQRANKASTPVIALTAGNTNEEKQHGIKVGMDRYLTKPFRIEDIRDVLETYWAVEFSIENSKVRSDELVSYTPTTTEKESPDPDVINLRSIENIISVERQTGNSILPKLLIGFDKQMTEKIIELNEALFCGDFRSVSAAAHAIKSMSANLGAEKVRLISADIETRSKLGDLEHLNSGIAKIEAAYKEFLIHAQELVQEKR
jgi:signal transduction histidine kinase/ligand-binding sensor domain-containing protein/CheY-like chemotaxis protein/HPt (histidine-containing phosphotransfer) domain-containing protein